MDSELLYLRRALRVLLAENERSAARLRVALYILSRAHYGKAKSEVISIKGIASKLGMQESNVSTALSSLGRLGLWRQETGAEDARTRSFYLVPIDAKKRKAEDAD
jgi:DNA-binding MarR family transcriptional regulator